MSLSVDPSSSPSQPGRSRRWLWIALIIAPLVVLQAGVGTLFVAPRLCGVTEPQRHGLDCDIPLPANATFLSQLPTPSEPAGVTTKILDYHVPYSTEQSIHDFYVQRLPTSGWNCANKGQPIDVRAIQGKRSVTISSVASGGEAAGVEMAISVSTFSKDMTDSCKN
jgi:hypothetical protein